MSQQIRAVLRKAECSQYYPNEKNELGEPKATTTKNLDLFGMLRHCTMKTWTGRSNPPSAKPIVRLKREKVHARCPWEGITYLDALRDALFGLLLGWGSLKDFEAPSITMLPIPTSIASLSSFSIFFLSEIPSTDGVSTEEGWRSWGPPLIHGWVRHWAAVGRFSGTKSSIGTRKSAMSFASCSLKSYFSMSTLLRGQKRRRRMCLKSPYLLKKSREYLPPKAIWKRKIDEYMMKQEKFKQVVLKAGDKTHFAWHHPKKLHHQRQVILQTNYTLNL